jgi:hypothetical protein
MGAAPPSLTQAHQQAIQWIGQQVQTQASDPANFGHSL